MAGIGGAAAWPLGTYAQQRSLVERLLELAYVTAQN
jgi:hypothetical protein